MLLNRSEGLTIFGLISRSAPRLDKNFIVLEDLIVANFDRIFRGKFRLFRDHEGNIAQQYTTGIGAIDILAEEPKTNSFVVIELTKGTWVR